METVTKKLEQVKFVEFEPEDKELESQKSQASDVGYDSISDTASLCSEISDTEIEEQVEEVVDAAPLRWDGLPETMKATVYTEAGKLEFKTVKTPTILKPTDVIVRVHKTTICGTDLHIRRGAVESAAPGRLLGHESISDVVATGAAVQKWKVGDRGLVTCITCCGNCRPCEQDFHGHCQDGGWILGHTIDGQQCEYVRVPHADNSMHRLPEGVQGEDEDKYLMLADILPTAYEVGLVDGNCPMGGTVAVVGVGPVGLACVLACAGMYKPERLFVVDNNKNRLQRGLDFGATDAIDNTKGDAVEQIMEATEGVGVDLVVECIGLPVGWYICQDTVKAGGNIAMLGVHGAPATLNLEKMWYRNFRMTAGMVHTYSVPQLMKAVHSGELAAEKLITHHKNLSEMMENYDIFANPGPHECLKILIKNDISAPVEQTMRHKAAMRSRRSVWSVNRH